MRLIDADALYERATTLEAQALDYVGKLIERDGDEPSVEWKVWSAILAERTAFKHDLMDAPTIDRPQGEWTPITKGLPKEPGTVLITHLSPLSPSGREVVSAWFDDDGLFYDSGRGTMMYSDVIAWAYPPKPYMGEVNDDN